MAILFNLVKKLSVVKNGLPTLNEGMTQLVYTSYVSTVVEFVCCQEQDVCT